MTTMTQAQKITHLLHHTRSTTFNANSTIELSRAMKGASPETLAIAVLQFSVDLMEASRECLKLKRDCSTVLPDNDTHSGSLH